MANQPSRGVDGTEGIGEGKVEVSPDPLVRVLVEP